MGLSIRPISGGRLTQFQKPMVTYMRGWGEICEPELLMFVIEGGESPILVDTGPLDPEYALKHHGYTLVQESDEVPVTALRNIGIEPRDVRLVINTHLHWDHCSNNREFENAKFIVQKRELHYALDPLEWNRVAFERVPGLEPGWQAVLQRTELVEGDVEVAPGVSTVLLPGHTPGSQGVLVEGDGCRYLIAGDCVPLYENWRGDDKAEHVPDGLYYDLFAYAASFQKIEALECEVIPSHDAAVLEHGVFA